MQWPRTLDSSLRSTFARLRHRTLGSSSVTPATAACRAPCTAPLPDFSRHLCQTSTGIVDSSLHSTFARPSHHSTHKPAQDPAPSAKARHRTLDRSLPRTASISEQQPHSSLTAAVSHRSLHSSLHSSLHCSLHSTFCRTSAPCTAPLPDVSTLHRTCHCTLGQQPAQHPANVCQTSSYFEQRLHNTHGCLQRCACTAPWPDLARTAACTAACTAPLLDFATALQQPEQPAQHPAQDGIRSSLRRTVHSTFARLRHKVRHRRLDYSFQLPGELQSYKPIQ